MDASPPTTRTKDNVIISLMNEADDIQPESLGEFLYLLHFPKRGMLMDGVALEQAPRIQTTEEDAARPDAGQS